MPIKVPIDLDCCVQTTHEPRPVAGRRVDGPHPNLRGTTDLTFIHPENLERSDVLFLATAHTETMDAMAHYLGLADVVVDLSGDFRLRDPDVYRAYYGFLYGHILNELQEYIVDPEENVALLRLGLHRLPARDFPNLRELAPVLADYDGEAELDEGISILLSGLAERLTTGKDAPAG